MNKFRWIGLACVLILPSGKICAQDNAAKPQDTKSTTKESTAPADQPAKPATTDPNYIIVAEDELNVSIWKEPDISRTVPVRPDGKISLPLLNDVQAAGITPMQLGTEITTRLKKFISEPQVTIIVTRFAGPKIFILGEVPHAGSFPYQQNMTILEALSAAGGITPFAKQSKIHVLRMENGKQTSYPFNYKEVLRGQRTEQNIPLKAGDTIVVP